MMYFNENKFIIVVIIILINRHHDLLSYENIAAIRLQSKRRQHYGSRIQAYPRRKKAKGAKGKEGLIKIFIKLTTITVVFVAMMIPLGIALLSQIASSQKASDLLENIYEITVGGNSGINPILFYVFDVGVKSRVRMFLGVSESAPFSKPADVKEITDINCKGTVEMLPTVIMRE